MLSVVSQLLVLAAAGARGVARDQPLLTCGRLQPLYLDGDGDGDGTAAWFWTRDSLSEGQKIPASVPGDLITDMQRASLIGDPLYETNFKSKVWDDADYSLHRDFSLDQREISYLLVFEGIKMGARVFLDGVLLLESSNQFLRQVVDVSEVLNRNAQRKSHRLTLTFLQSNTSINAESRWMGCSGAWDWAPYGSTLSPKGSHTFTKGIWKSVYLLAKPTPTAAVVTQISTQIFYEGEYPTDPMVDISQVGPWKVLVNVSFASPVASVGKLLVSGEWAPEESFTLSVSKGQSSAVVEMRVSAGKTKLWWPSGMGSQPLYNIWVEYSDASSPGSVIRTSRRVGFRTAHLVTAQLASFAEHPHEYQTATNDTSNGSGSFTMRFAINGAFVWVRGANFIPVDELEGRVQEQTYTGLLQSAKAAHFNMLRVWGGGIWQYDAFYDECDQLGLLVFHDAMYGFPWFGGNSGVPTPNAQQEDEIRSNVQRLSVHPCIVVWNACNECDPLAKDMSMASFVLPILAQADPSRALWPGSPSRGFASGVSALTGLPNGKPLVPKSQYDDAPEPGKGACGPRKFPIETHGPYQHGEGFKTVNSDAALELFDPNIPPALAPPAELGIDCPGVFASEFGASAWSSFESVSPTLAPEHWGLHAVSMVERNYAADNFICSYFPFLWPADFDGNVGEKVLRSQLYYAMLAQALQQKSDISVRRSRNEMAVLTWQLGEIWPTGGWGSLEYATAGFTPGQVSGGRWKALHFFLRDFLFRDLFVSCGADARCVVKNDGLAPFSGRLSLSLLHIASGRTHPLSNSGVDLGPAGRSDAATFVCAVASPKKVATCATWTAALIASGTGCTVTTCILQMSLAATNAAASPVFQSFELLVPPRNLTSLPPKAIVTLRVLLPRETSNNASANANAKGHSLEPIPILVSSDETALFVGLVSLAQGQFSDNFFILPKGSQRQVLFLPLQEGQEPLLVSTLRADHVALSYNTV